MREATEARRQDILSAALRCFEEHGYEATSLAQVRDLSGASIGSIYHHFGSKAGIAAALYREGLADHRARMLARLRAASSGKAFITGVVEFHIEWAREHPAWARYLHGMRRIDAVAAIEPELRADTRAFLKEAAALLSRFVERGEVRRAPLDVVIAQLFGPAREITRMWLAGQTRVDLDDAKKMLAEAAWRALRAKEQHT